MKRLIEPCRANLSREEENQLLREMFSAWTIFSINEDTPVDVDLAGWMSDNAKGETVIFGTMLFFKDKKDAVWFRLRWGDYISDYS